MARDTPRLRRRTIDDFGDQWTRYTDNDGFYGSTDLLADVLGPLIPVSAFQGKRVADIGSGTGRIVGMLLRAGAERVLAVEPSRAVEVLRRNLEGDSKRVDILHASGDALPADLNLDFVVSIGVLHHVPAPRPVVDAAFRALRPGGRIIVWLYGSDGHRAIVSTIRIMRAVTTRLPHWMLTPVASIGTVILDLYIPACRRFAFLPLADYVVNVLSRFDRRKRYLVVYDQLRPAYAKYYAGDEARALLEGSGFVDVELYHRRGYSWTAIGRRPAEDESPARG